jgi:glycosyl transferase family 2
MRISIFSADTGIACWDKKVLSERLGDLVPGEGIDSVQVTSYGWPVSESSVNEFYLLPGRETLKMKICCSMLRIIDENRLAPAFFSSVPLKFCKEQILSTIWGFDPDIILVLGLNWGKEFKKMLQKNCPQWGCIADADRRLAFALQRHPFDPSAKVSIVLPTYNGTRYIHKSIESCLRQTYSNIEVLLVDDGSTVDIAGIVNSFADPRIHYIRHENNRGLSEALNTGFKVSTGKYLTWTSDDNYYADNAIERMVAFLQSYPKIDFVYADQYKIDECDNVLSVQRNKPPNSLKIHNFIGACFLYRRNVYETIGDYNREMSLVEDYDYWVRVSGKFAMQQLFIPLYYYRVHKDSLTGKFSDRVLEKIRLVQQQNGINC